MLKRHWPDAAIIASITIVIGLIAQQWTGLDTPDSGFYFSLANFGSQVTERAPIDSYYWTRLGVIGPTYALTQIFGPWIGYFIWRMALLAIIVTAFYVAAKKFNAPRSQAATLAGTLAASTVILSYLGNPYVTATALAAIAITITAALYSGRAAAVVGGASLGWLAMINPYAALLGGSILIAVNVQRTLAGKDSHKFQKFLKHLLLAASLAIGVFGFFLLIGTQLFPGMNWLSTYLEWNAKLNYSDFASKSPIWLTDFSLLIPISMLIVIATQWWRQRNSQTQAALTIGLTTLGFTLAFLPAMAGITLEATIYTVMLWIPMSLALIMSLSGQILTARWVPPVAIATVLGFGFISPNLNGGIAITIVILITAALIFVRSPKLITAVLIVFLASAQLIQNSRDQIGLYYSSPFGWAYQDNPIKMKLANSLKAQEWLLNNTTPEDQILTYVDGDWLAGDRNLYVAASMQLWGENRISVTEELRPEDFQRVEALKPTVLALYGFGKSHLEGYLSRFPGMETSTSTNKCTDFAWPYSGGDATLCLVRIN
jgi:hypothetical protein